MGFGTKSKSHTEHASNIAHDHDSSLHSSQHDHHFKIDLSDVHHQLVQLKLSQDQGWSNEEIITHIKYKVYLRKQQRSRILSKLIIIFFLQISLCLLLFNFFKM